MNPTDDPTGQVTTHAESENVSARGMLIVGNEFHIKIIAMCLCISPSVVEGQRKQFDQIQDIVSLTIEHYKLGV